MVKKAMEPEDSMAFSLFRINCAAQGVAAHSHPHQLVPIVDVAVGLLVADPLGADAAGVVLHFPVPHIQLSKLVFSY